MKTYTEFAIKKAFTEVKESVFEATRSKNEICNIIFDNCSDSETIKIFASMKGAQNEVAVNTHFYKINCKHMHGNVCNYYLCECYYIETYEVNEEGNFIQNLDIMFVEV